MLNASAERHNLSKTTNIPDDLTSSEVSKMCILYSINCISSKYLQQLYITYAMHTTSAFSWDFCAFHNFHNFDASSLLVERSQELNPDTFDESRFTIALPNLRILVIA